MNTDAVTKVVIFAEHTKINRMLNGLANDDKINIVGKTYNIGDLKRITKENKNSVVIFYTGKSEELIAELCSYFKEQSIRFVAICTNAQTGFDMLKRGASEMIILHENDQVYQDKFFFPSLKSKIHIAGKLYIEDNTRILKTPGLTSFKKIIAIGSSTGGTEAVHKIITKMPADTPPILIVQHMPPVFTKLYAQRLNANGKMSVWEARDGDILRSGLVLLAPGDYHMSLACRNGVYYVECKSGERVHGQCPAADVLFNSIAQIAADISLGIILTGMGADGAAGLLKMRQNGSRTLGQDKESCVVYGMPKAAYDMGAVERQVHLDKMADTIIELISR